MAAGKTISLPEAFSSDWAYQLGRKLDEHTRALLPLKHLLPTDVLCQLLSAVCDLLAKEPTLLEVTPPSADGATVTVVGDTHGQLHDVIGPLLDTAGLPSAQSLFIFNGDFVDRGAWGVELLAVLGAWKLALPDACFLVRGNHESVTCTKMYGFWQELRNKYGAAQSKTIFKQCKRLFATLPLAACVAGSTLVLHGGLFRKPVAVKRGKKRRSRAASAGTIAQLGSLADLRAAGKGGMDPSGLGSTLVATDVMWSDPVQEEACFRTNDSRGVGIIFGADITERFLHENGLKLIIRSHEGPDARVDRDDMPSMIPGYSVDHVTASGKLMTVFSAPDYPQFQLPGKRYNNQGAVVRLCAPDFATPAVLQYSASLPRPAAEATYDMGVPDSDEEIELGGYASDMSGASALSEGGNRQSCGSSMASGASTGEAAALRGGDCNDSAALPIEMLPAAPDTAAVAEEQQQQEAGQAAAESGASAEQEQQRRQPAQQQAASAAAPHTANVDLLGGQSPQRSQPAARAAAGQLAAFPDAADSTAAGDSQQPAQLPVHDAAAQPEAVSVVMPLPPADGPAAPASTASTAAEQPAPVHDAVLQPDAATNGQGQAQELAHSSLAAAVSTDRSDAAGGAADGGALDRVSGFTAAPSAQQSQASDTDDNVGADGAAIAAQKAMGRRSSTRPSKGSARALQARKTLPLKKVATKAPKPWK